MKQNVNKPLLLFFRGVLRMLFKGYFVLFKGFRVQGRENLPVKGPAIVICNHAAFVDSVFLITSLRKRFIVCGAKPKYFDSRKKRILMGIANIMKVENENQFLSDCKAFLEQNEILLIYPEMGRFKEAMADFKDWASKVALSSSAPVIPCYLYGTTEGQNGKKKLMVGDTIIPGGTPEDLTTQFRIKIEELKEKV